MMESKRRVISRAKEDGIRNLPEHLIDSILERVPIEDAVRTSILSKKWRYRWTTMRALVFDEHFSNKYEKNGAFGRNGIIRIINQVVFLQKGPILKFHLHIPHEISLDSFQEVDQWMHFLSRNNVIEIFLTNSNRRYELSSHVFSCLQLTKLSLENCFFKPPLGFVGFPNLEEVILAKIDFGANLSETEINLPRLKKLYLVSCTNVYNFNIKASKLQSLHVFYCRDVVLLRILHSPCLTHVLLSFILIKDNVQVERVTLPMMISNLPNIEKLSVHGLLLKSVLAENIPKWLPHAVNSLKRLFVYIELGDLHQLEGVLCLLRNSPNLERLSVWSFKWKITMLKKPGVIDYDVGAASNYLEAPTCLDCTLSQLKTVEIRWSEGSRPELLFVKLLLAHSPSLEKITITPRGASDVQKGSDIAKDVMQFPRTSTKAKVIYLDPKT